MPELSPPDDDAALEALLRAERNGPPWPGESTPWDFWRRWPDGVVRGRARPIISKLLVDDDEVVRARSLEFVRLWSAGKNLTTPRLLEVAEQRPELFAAQVVEGQPLRDWMGHALSDRAYDVGEPVAKLLRRLCAEAPATGAGGVLGRYYPEFAIEKLPVWGDAAERFFIDAAGAIALYRRDSVIPFLGAARALSQPLRADLVEAVEHFIKRDDAAAAAMAKSEGFPPPSKPAPTAEYCRRAVGL